MSKDTFASYAQYHEDLVLAALLATVKKGFYVDVGANDEEYHSVTKYFYERGWRGINIDPIQHFIEDFDKKRPDDINLTIGISDKPGTLKFREYPEQDGYSTLSSQTMHEANKAGLPYRDYEVEVDTLKNVFAKYKVKTIDFLKVDVEGFEEQVLKGNDWDKYRPKVICIEANHREGTNWSKYLIGKSYTRVIADGLNEYYLAHEALNLFDDFAERAAMLAHNGVRAHHLTAWKSERTKLQQHLENQDAHIKGLRHAVNERDKLLDQYQNPLFLGKRFIRASGKKLLVAFGFKEAR